MTEHAHKAHTTSQASAMSTHSPPGVEFPAVQPPAHGDVWLGLTGKALSVTAAAEWVILPGCGASVIFTGTTRDRSPHRFPVEKLTYEAYESHVIPKLNEIHVEMRRRWQDLGRVAILHRVGEVAVCEVSVVVAVSAPHKTNAFLAALFAINCVKSTVPIWKREHWSDGEDWAAAPQHIQDVTQVDGFGDLRSAIDMTLT